MKFEIFVEWREHEQFVMFSKAVFSVLCPTNPSGALQRHGSRAHSSNHDPGSSPLWPGTHKRNWSIIPKSVPLSSKT